MKLFFTMWIIDLQAFNYNIAIGNLFHKDLNIRIESDLTKLNNEERTSLKHIRDNVYDITCYVSDVIEGIALIKIEDLYFMIDFVDEILVRHNTYNFIGEIYYDTWNARCFSGFNFISESRDILRIQGVIKNISYDTASLCKTDKKTNSPSAMKPKFDHKIKQSTLFGFSEEEKFPNTSGLYLVEIDTNVARTKKYIKVILQHKTGQGFLESPRMYVADSSIALEMSKFKCFIRFEYFTSCFDESQLDWITGKHNIEPDYELDFADQFQNDENVSVIHSPLCLIEYIEETSNKFDKYGNKI